MNINDMTALELLEVIVGSCLTYPDDAVALPVPLEEGDYLLVCTLEPATPELTSSAPMVVH